MPQPLDAWQTLMEQHFAALAISRAAAKLPIFALEHPLTAEQFREIAEQLRARVARNLPLIEHWLLWVIYATEEGYSYDGTEFWDSFEAHTPRWREYESRAQFKLWFRKFQKKYNGVEPRGPWARQFNNIVWPIRHAILPKYLQYQFAEALHGLRFKLARLDSLDAVEVGHLLADNSWNASKRLREFLQQEELSGRIVLALLNHDIADRELIYSSTLSRIIADLEKVHKAKVWLKETQRATDVFRGVRRGYNTSSAEKTSEVDDVAVDTLSLRMRPRVMLRKMDKENWSAILDIPDFSPVAALNASLANFLRTTRCQITGDGIWLPAGWLLSGTQRRAFGKWPGAGTPVIRFERLNGNIENILNADFLIPSLPYWLFRKGEDGLAHLVIGRTIRAGQHYILLTPEPLTVESAMLKSCNVQCEGVHGTEIEVPDMLHDDDIEFFQKIKLNANRNIRTWPAGFVARGWDGDGYSEWLTTEAPCFGIVSDHSVQEYQISVDDGAIDHISASAFDKPIFLQLPLLTPGRHSVRINAKRTGEVAEGDLEGFLNLDVRDPIPWRPGTAAYSGLFVTTEPTDPSFEQLEDGELSLTVSGPEGELIEVHLVLAGRSGTQPQSYEIAKLDLPISAATWSQRISKELTSDKFAWKLVEGTSGVLKVGNENLGWFILKLEREARPLRWVCRYVDHTTKLRLTDDTGAETDAGVFLRTFCQPLTAAKFDIASMGTGRAVEKPGGLFIARQGDAQDVLVVSTPEVRGFGDLLISPDPRALDDQGARPLLVAVKLWQQARLAGPLAGLRRDHVVDAMLEAFFVKLCGQNWGRLERLYMENPADQDVVDQLSRMFERKSAGFSVVLRRDFAKMSEGRGSGINWFFDTASRYGICSNCELCETALRIASEPTFLLTQTDEEMQGTISAVVGYPGLLRGARLVAINSMLSEPPPKKRLLPSWQWS
jgi:hypothetical protein